MKCLILIVMLSGLSLLVTISTVICQPPPPPPQTKAYLLVFQWPKTVCTIGNCQAEYSTEMPQTFKVHGLWPSTVTNYQPIINCAGPEFSGSALKPIRNSLKIYWPNLLQSENIFWKTQWNKHGKCSGSTQVGYFDKTLALARSNSGSLIDALRKSGIGPGGLNVTPQRIRDAIKSKIGFECRVVCKVGPRNAKYLHEIRLCLDNGFNRQDCPQNNWFSPDCGTADTKLVFPTP